MPGTKVDNEIAITLYFVKTRDSVVVFDALVNPDTPPIPYFEPIPGSEFIFHLLGTEFIVEEVHSAQYPDSECYQALEEPVKRGKLSLTFARKYEAYKKPLKSV